MCLFSCRAFSTAQRLMRASTSSAVSSVPGLKWRITTERDDVLESLFFLLRGFVNTGIFFKAIMA